MGKITRLWPLSLFTLILLPSITHAETFGKPETIVEDSVETVEPAFVESELSSVLEKVEKTPETLVRTVEEVQKAEVLPVEEVKQTVERSITSVDEVTKQSIGMVEDTVNKTITQTTATAEKALAPTITRAQEKVQPLKEAVDEKKTQTDALVERSFEFVTPPAVPTPPVKTEEEKIADGVEETPILEQPKPTGPLQSEEEKNEKSTTPTAIKQLNIIESKRIVEDAIETGYEDPDSIVEGVAGKMKAPPSSSEVQPEKVRLPATIPPVTNNKSKAVSTAPVFSSNGSPILTLPSGKDLGQSALVEAVVLDEAVGRLWRNPEEIGSSQWIHAPPTKPPKTLLFK